MCMIWVSGPSSSLESNEVFCGAVEEDEGGEKLYKQEEEEESRDGLKEAIEEELEAGEVFVLRRYFSRYFKVPTCSTLTYLYKIGDLEEDLYVPYPAVSAVLRGVW
ncbi:hypothetical protein L249_5430, partial [Ophiocordyceps polyrhachis-furcata BCC 54312]